MNQLSLFKWAKTERLKTDLGNKCPLCSEDDQWVPIYEDNMFIQLMCHTVMTEPDGTYYDLCCNTVEVEK